MLEGGDRRRVAGGLLAEVRRDRVRRHELREQEDDGRDAEQQDGTRRTGAATNRNSPLARPKRGAPAGSLCDRRRSRRQRTTDRTGRSETREWVRGEANGARRIGVRAARGLRAGRARRRARRGQRHGCNVGGRRPAPRRRVRADARGDREGARGGGGARRLGRGRDPDAAPACRRAATGTRRFARTARRSPASTRPTRPTSSPASFRRACSSRSSSTRSSRPS